MNGRGVGDRGGTRLLHDVEERRRQLETVVAEEWEYELRESPELATMLGDHRYDDRWSDLSLAHLAREKQDLSAWLARFQALETEGLPEQEELTQRLMVRKLGERLEALDLKDYEMPIDQMNGIHLMVPLVASIAPLDSAEHVEAYLARLQAIPALLGQAMELARQGTRDGLVPPRYLLEKTVLQCRTLARAAGPDNPFVQVTAKIGDDIPADERQRLIDHVVAVVDGEVRPAYAELAAFIASDYAPHGQVSPGLWALPRGEERYRFAIRTLTTTEMEPDAIHELGLAEVARIEGEQAVVARRLGFPELQAFRRWLRTEARFAPSSAEQLLDTYRSYIAGMLPQLPRLFGLLPKAGLEVRPVEEFREKDAAAAEYYPGTPDGSRPGIVYVNTGDLEQRTLISAETIAYHEGVPGHHLQIAIAQSLPGLPPFRRHASFTAYIEGWALYSERLGKDIGFYEDAYSDFSRLSHELLRAARLVLDTGVHHKRWTREQMVAYFHEHTDETEPEIEAETDRYIVLPAQALAYKLGQLKILELRERAERELAGGYDVRAFHDRVLEGGALPLDVLEARVSAWIETQKAAG